MTPKHWPIVPSVSFVNVFLRYRPSSPLVLKGLSFSVLPGQKVGIAGRTGSGKSTLFTALLRFVELSGGAIFIDGTNIANLGLKALRQVITLIPQSPLIFKATLEENMSPSGTASPEEIRAVLREVSMSKFPLTYEMQGSGMNLSVGERQLLSIGRALLSHTKLLLIDEATAGIDEETDSLIQSLFAWNFAECTTLTISHRVSSILNSEFVIVMNDGRVVECGHPSTLEFFQ